MRLSRKMFYLGEIITATGFLWMSGLLFGENIWMNLINPTLYGKKISMDVSVWAQRISDGLIGGMAPMWILKKDQAEILSANACELYPTETMLAAIYNENHPKDGEAISEESNITAAANIPSASEHGMVYTAEMLRDYNFFVNQFYLVDSSTYADGLLDAQTFMDMDLTIDVSGEEPKVLIYHTHSQEGFADSREGMWQDTVVGAGEVLKENLEKRYGISVYHLTESFDVVDGVVDRSEAYTYAEERIWEILQEYPSIKVIVDLHRDGVPEGTRLVTEIDGKPAAQLMLLNGLCRTSASGPIEYLQNDYLTENLAFSFKIQSKAEEYYPELMRKIYLRSYQYNLHILPRSILVECGAHTNTVEEVKNSMPYLADLLYMVLSGNG